MEFPQIIKWLKLKELAWFYFWGTYKALGEKITKWNHLQQIPVIKGIRALKQNGEENGIFKARID